MKRYALYILVAFTSFAAAFSQPGKGNGFSYCKDITYFVQNYHALKLDLYIPQVTKLPSGIGIGVEDQNQNSSQETVMAAWPVIIWIATGGADKFPCPVASCVGNGYAVISIQVEQQSEILKYAGKAIAYMKANAAAHNLDTANH